MVSCNERHVNALSHGQIDTVGQRVTQLDGNLTAAFIVMPLLVQMVLATPEAGRAGTELLSEAL